MHIFFFFLIMACSFLDLSASWAETVLAQMSLEEKVAQLIMPGVRLNLPQSIVHAQELVTQYRFGGLLLVNVGNGFFQNSVVTDYLTPTEQSSLVAEFQSHSKCPLLIAQDLEWGLSMRLRDALRFPHAMTLAAAQDDVLISRIAQEIGRQAHHAGVHINFAPVVDINNNPGNPVIHDRSFGEDRETVTRYGIAYMKGLGDAGIIACAKHFPGHGDTDVDSHRDLPCLSHTKKRLHELELYPFKKLIDAGLPMIMTAHLHIPSLDNEANLPASLSYTITTELLRNELGFTGIIVTDGLRMSGVTQHFTSAQAAVRAFLAGNDILLDPQDPREALQGILDAVKQGIITEEDIHARVKKLLLLKESLKLPTKQQASGNHEYITDYARALKKEAYRKAVTLVRDPKELVPLDARRTYAYIDIDPLMHTMQTSLSAHTHLTVYPSCIQAAALAESTIIVPLCRLTRKKDEGYGISDHIQTLLNELVALGKEVIVLVFGTPYALALLPHAVSVVVAYEDDSDAQQATTEVLAGSFHPTGKLPVLRTI